MWCDKALCLVFMGVVVSAGFIRVEDVNLTLLSNELELWMQSGEETAAFREVMLALAIPEDLRHVGWRSYSGGRAVAMCTVCNSVAKTMIALRRAGMSDEHIRIKIIKLCTLLQIEKENVCKGAVELNLPIILHIIDNNRNITAPRICGVLLESKSCPLTDTAYQWRIEVDPSSPKTIPTDNLKGTMKVVQLTDIHYDPKYEPNGNALCGEPNCCRKGQNSTNTGGKLAGFWGDYNSCDTPWHAVSDVIDHISTTHKDINYVYFTGDIIDHGVWETTKDQNIASIYTIYTELFSTFNLSVYPILGNHEPHPVNQFAPEGITDESFSTKWLYDLIADIWIKYGGLPESTRKTIQRGGYYTVSPERGFRIIALNNNDCYAYNWWLFYDPQLPLNQLQWLHDTLLQAERNNEFVHILAHVPPASNECLITWRKQYHRLINRFSNIISGQFNGHTHFDELNIFYNEDLKVNNIAFNGGSVTTYKNLNPNYKIYLVDCENYAVQDYDNWIFNMNEANMHPNRRPSWKKSYSFKSEYNLKDLSEKSLYDFVLRLRDDDEMLDRYYRHYVKNAEPSLKVPCDRVCKLKYVCNIVTGEEDHDIQCLKVLNIEK